MKNWLMNIAIVSVLSSIADMILPSSYISRYAKLCLSLLLTSVIINPLIIRDKTDFSLKVPDYRDFQIEEQISLIDKEFSIRFTNEVINETGFDNISISAKLNYDSINSITISGAYKWQEEEINNVLTTKYKIPMEIITYEPA